MLQLFMYRLEINGCILYLVSVYVTGFSTSESQYMFCVKLIENYRTKAQWITEWRSDATRFVEDDGYIARLSEGRLEVTYTNTCACLQRHTASKYWLFSVLFDVRPTPLFGNRCLSWVANRFTELSLATHIQVWVK